MDLKSGYPFWAVKNGLMRAFPPLTSDLRCDVAVVGAGITGALIADELVSHGHDVVVVDQRDAGWGSTAASTALLQYEIDVHMTDLARHYGMANAALAYASCVDAIDLIGALARSVRDVDFLPMRSLYLASRARHRKALDWPGMYRLAMDPEKARRYKEESEAGGKPVCSMCGSLCSINIDNHTHRPESVVAAQDVAGRRAVTDAEMVAAL